MLLFVVVSLLKSNGETKSVIGAARCDSLDWVLFSAM